MFGSNLKRKKLATCLEFPVKICVYFLQKFTNKQMDRLRCKSGPDLLVLGRAFDAKIPPLPTKFVLDFADQYDSTFLDPSPKLLINNKKRVVFKKPTVLERCNSFNSPLFSPLIRLISSSTPLIRR